MDLRLRRRITGLRLRAERVRFLRETHVEARDDLVSLGSSYGGWTVAADLLSDDSVCYLAGTGTDISFDLALIARFGCKVHAFDPVPAARKYVEQAARFEPRLVFHPVGLWACDTTLHFHAPEDPSWVSHSATNLKGTSRAFEATVRGVPSLMDELGHGRLDLLKVSAEGSEYEILDGTLSGGLRPRTICVEFAQPTPMKRVRAQCEHVKNAGYDLVRANIHPWNWKLSFIARAPLGRVSS